MKLDAELEGWRQQWQADPATIVPGDLRARDLREKVERQSRFMRLLVVADCCVTVGIGGGAIAWAVLAPGTETVLLAAATWIFVAVAWVFGLSNRRGTWHPEGSTTSAFLELSVRRARRRLSAAKFGAGLYVVEIVFCLAWIFHYHSLRSPLALGTFLTSVPVIAVELCTIVLAGVLVWYCRRRRDELAYLLSLQRQLGEEPESFREEQQRWNPSRKWRRKKIQKLGGV